MTFLPPYAVSRMIRQRGMTLLELMVAVSLLTVIVLGLYKMFDRTQAAMRSGVNQVDVQEGARAASDVVFRDIEQLGASKMAGECNLYVSQMNFTNASTSSMWTNILVQSLPGGLLVTNSFHECFLLTKSDSWGGVGYIVAPATSRQADLFLYTNSVGSLMRFAAGTNITLLGGSNLFNQFLTNSVTEITRMLDAVPGARYQTLNRIMDGVVRFQVRAYDKTGALIPGIPTNAITMLHTNLPGFVEYELAVLEPQILEQARSFPDLMTMSNYLSGQAARVHLFRQRIPIRTAAP